MERDPSGDRGGNGRSSCCLKSIIWRLSGSLGQPTEPGQSSSQAEPDLLVTGRAKLAGTQSNHGLLFDTVVAMPLPTIPYRPPRLPPEVMLERARQFYTEMDRRRSVRMFSAQPVAKELVELAVMTASTAPSGAHRQPWKFVVTGDSGLKRRIRVAAEEEERTNYEGGRLPAHWLEAVEPLGTDADKSYLETVPWIVVLFEERHGYQPDGSIRHNYYVKESVGIAAGLFLAAIHHMGLATLTHTPSPMAFLSTVLGRPKNERPFCLFPVGSPADGCVVPDLFRKALDQVMVEP